MSDESRFQFVLTDEQKNRVGQSAAVAAGAGAVVLATTAPAQADAVEDLTAGVNSIKGMYDVAVPIAVTVIVFSAAAMVIKRLMYA